MFDGNTLLDYLTVCFTDTDRDFRKARESVFRRIWDLDEAYRGRPWIGLMKVSSEWGMAITERQAKSFLEDIKEVLNVFFEKYKSELAA